MKTNMSFEGNPVTGSNGKKRESRLNAPQYGKGHENRVARGNTPEKPTDLSGKILRENLKRMKGGESAAPEKRTVKPSSERGGESATPKERTVKSPSERDREIAATWKRLKKGDGSGAPVQSSTSAREAAIAAKLARRRKKYDDPEGWKIEMEKEAEILARRKKKFNDAAAATAKQEEEKKAGAFRKPAGVVKTVGKKTNVLSEEAVANKKRKKENQKKKGKGGKKNR